MTEEAKEKMRQARLEKIVKPAETIEVAEKPQEEKKTLFQRMTGEKPLATRKTRSSKKVDPTIITKVAPLVLSTFAVAFVRQRLPDPYKICAPTEEEVVNMVKPYFNILSRYVEITGHLSENTIDLISALLASIIYGTRAYVTYVHIQEYENATSSEQRGRDSELSTSRDTQNIIVQEQSTRNGAADNNYDGEQLARYESSLMDTLLKRDTDGRRKLGLL